jgi:hypothetical protein
LVSAKILLLRKQSNAYAYNELELALNESIKNGMKQSFINQHKLTLKPI